MRFVLARRSCSAPAGRARPLRCSGLRRGGGLRRSAVRRGRGLGLRLLGSATVRVLRRRSTVWVCLRGTSVWSLGRLTGVGGARRLAGVASSLGRVSRIRSLWRLTGVGGLGRPSRVRRRPGVLGLPAVWGLSAIWILRLSVRGGIRPVHGSGERGKGLCLEASSLGGGFQRGPADQVDGNRDEGQQQRKEEPSDRTGRKSRYIVSVVADVGGIDGHPDVDGKEDQPTHVRASVVDRGRFSP